MADAAEIQEDQIPSKVGFVENLRLAGIRLISLNTAVEIKGGAVPVKAMITTEVSVAVASDLQHIHVNAGVTLVGRPSKESFENPNPDESILNLALQYQALYVMKDVSNPIELVEEHGQEIAALGTHMLWPYIRSQVQTTTVSMGLPPVTMPMYIAAIQQLQQDDSPTKVILGD